MKNQHAAVRVFVVMLLGTAFGWVVFQLINYGTDKLECGNYFGAFEVFCNAFDNAKIFVRNWKKELEMLVVAEALALLAVRM
eukprot:SAG11_NODE_5091_length_1666_cov_4.223357_2_plen_82_part_00